jgi:putative redox protein
MTTPETAQDPASAATTVVVEGMNPKALTQRISVGEHQLVADEPQPIGEDAGPTPYDLLLGALGACTSMTVQMYAKRKDWPLDQVRVSLRHSRIHAQDCADCETRIGMLDHIDLGVELIGDLDDAQRQRLLLIAGRCPIHQTLTSEIHIVTTLR